MVHGNQSDGILVIPKNPDSKKKLCKYIFCLEFFRTTANDVNNVMNSFRGKMAESNL
jgi:hypothetical protein